MIVVVNGYHAGTKETGCALCGGTWGNHYEIIEGDNLFFCCDICAKAFKNIINEAKKRGKLNKIDYIDIKGNFYKGRTIEAKDSERSYKFYVKFSDEGDIIELKELNNA
ncbi:TA0938 family protein [Caldisphaera sp.]|uniref:TA0938 family protein n=1 Tax=Caldisphaera sp. TaxID=2060322 RepID=UPI0025BC9D98|nr:TA0938 family protein [Caldisphaera sp.]